MADDIAQIARSFQFNRVTNYMDVISCCLTIYDWMLTLGREVELVWLSPWSPVKILFLVTRYTPFIELGFVVWPLATNDISPRACYVDYQWTAWTNITGILFAEVILMLRTWAVYDRRRSVGFFLAFWTIATWVPNLASVGIFLQSLKFGPLPALEDAPGVGCHVVAGSSILFISWVMIIVSEAAALLLMLFVAIREYRLGRDSDLFKTVFRDGTIFYLYLFAFSTANVIVVLTTPAGLINLLSIAERMVHSILTSRIILRLRELGARGGSLGWDTFSTGVGGSSARELEFARAAATARTAGTLATVTVDGESEAGDVSGTSGTSVDEMKEGA